MDHPLDDCRLKIGRAKEQFDALYDEIIKFDEAHPYLIELHVDPETGEQVIECAEPPAFPRRWGVLVGEMAHNLRSSLDYLIGVLVTKSGGKPNGDTAFPISKTETRYLRKNKRNVTYRDRLLKGLPGPLKERIDALQPFNRHGELAYADALLGLSDLANRDKHRDLAPAYAWVNVPGAAFSFPTDDEMRELEIRMPREGGFKVEAQFKRGAGTPAAIVMYPKLEVQRPTGVEVVFGRDPSRLLGLDDLAQLIGYVESIIESFDGDLKPEAA